MRRAAWLLTALVAAFAFRLFYGLSMPFWYEDERQVYLIGLRSFARDEWPYFGADVVWTGGRVPGALLGWLVRAPLELIALPEGPIVLINLLSLAALTLFAWYLVRRLPLVPWWLIGAALAVLPWTLNFSTHVMNPSYVLAGAIVFFVGFFEATTVFRRGLLPVAVAWLLMGAGLFWILQMHLSWVLLPIFVAAAGISLVFDRESRARWLHALAGFVAGAALTGSLLAPTILRHGLAAGQVDSAVQFQSQGLFGIVTTAARLLSFASFETNRFLGLSTSERAVVLWHQPWMIPFVIVIAVAGLAQPIWMIVTALRRRSGPGAGEWRYLRLLMLAAIVLVYGSYFFSVRGQQAHSFYALLPLAVVFAATSWQVRAESHGGPMRGLERLAAAAIVSSILVHAGLAIHRWPRLSLYANRALVAAAIADRNDRYLGDRRGTTVALDGDQRPDPVAGLEVVRSEWMPIVGRFSSFAVTIANHSRTTAWLDIRYRTSYADAGGQVLAVRDGVIKQILQPGETRTFDRIADDRVPSGAHSMAVTVIGAEPVIPVRTR